MQCSGVGGVFGFGVQVCLLGGGGLIHAWVGLAGAVGVLLMVTAQVGLIGQRLDTGLAA